MNISIRQPSVNWERQPVIMYTKQQNNKEITQYHSSSESKLGISYNKKGVSFQFQ